LDKRKKEEYKAAVLAYLLTAALLYAGLLLPVFLIAVPFVLVYAIARAGYLLGGGAILLGFLTVAYFEFFPAVLLAGAFMPVAFGTGYMIRKKKRFHDSVIVSCAMALAGAALSIALLSLFTKSAATDVIVSYAGSSMKAMGDADIMSLYQLVRSPDLLTGAITQQALWSTPPAEAVAIMQELLRNMLSIWFVTIIGIYSLLNGLLCYIIPRAIVKKSMDVAPAPAFSDYALPKRFWLAFLVSYLFAMTGASFGWRSFDIVQLTVYNLYAFVFSVQALSVFDYFYRKRNMSTGVRAVLHVLTALILSMLLMWIGIIENISSMRKRTEEREV
jgi:hypothetical protein